MIKKEIKKTAHGLYIELVKLQKEIISSKLKLLVILEGRDTAGKDGTIKNIIKHLSPRETKVVALGKPSDREEKEWYFQRYVLHLPIAGELTLFNRSWYNRLGVEKVMHFCSDKEYKSFFSEVELFEKILHDAGFIIKYLGKIVLIAGKRFIRSFQPKGCEKHPSGHSAYKCGRRNNRVGPAPG
jgi:polyphosphate kinase 2 (PPK2 family)